RLINNFGTGFGFKSLSTRIARIFTATVSSCAQRVVTLSKTAIPTRVRFMAGTSSYRVVYERRTLKESPLAPPCHSGQGGGKFCRGCCRRPVSFLGSVSYGMRRAMNGFITFGLLLVRKRR